MEGGAVQSPEQRRDALVERIFGSCIGFMEILSIYVGDRLGFYRALVGNSGASTSQLADATGTNERYAREWLEQQAVAGILAVEDAGAAPEKRRYSIPAGHEEMLLDPESLAYVVPMARFAVSFTSALPAVEEAFRSGGGVAWTAYGEEGREAQAAANRPQFTHLLASEWLPAMPDVHERLSSDPPPGRAPRTHGGGRAHHCR